MASSTNITARTARCYEVKIAEIGLILLMPEWQQRLYVVHKKAQALCSRHDIQVL